MKKIILLSILISCFCFTCYSQTVRTEASYKADDLKKSLDQWTSLLIQNKLLLSRIIKSFDDGLASKEMVDEARSNVASTEEKIKKLRAEYSELNKKPQTVAVPTKQIDLLRLLVIQNDRIIKLLEDLASKP